MIWYNSSHQFHLKTFSSLAKVFFIDIYIDESVCVCVYVVFMCVKCGYETDLQLILFEWNAEEEMRILFSIQIASLIKTLVFLSLYIGILLCIRIRTLRHQLCWRKPLSWMSVIFQIATIFRITLYELSKSGCCKIYGSGCKMTLQMNN